MPGKKGARIGDLHVCNFHGGGPITPGGPPAKVFLETMPAARVGDFAVCPGPAPDVLLQGALTVFVNGLPLVRMGDLTAHGGSVGMGAVTVEVGDQTFAPPPNLKLKGPATFKNKVIRDLVLLSATGSGKALIARLDASRQPIDVVPEKDPHNSFCAPASWGDAQ